MALDPVPYVMGNGALNTPESARTAQYAATNGAEGVVSPGDLKVVPLGVPGAAVQALLGNALVRNRAAGNTTQTYSVRAPSSTQVEVAATGSGSGRSDLVVLEIVDPGMPGNGGQVIPAEGPYVFLRVVPNVPAGTKRLQDVAVHAGRTAITLARIDLPASTATVTAAMITDLRRVALPRTTRVFDLARGTTAQLNTATSEASFPQQTLAVDIPEWATDFIGVITANGILQVGADEAMSTRVRLGPSMYSLASITDQDASAGNAQTRVALFGFAFVIPASMRGTTQTLSMWSQRLYASSTGRFATSPRTQISFDGTFKELPS